MAVDPNTITSPANFWTDQQVIFDGGSQDSSDQGFSFAVGRWEGTNVLACRWNGISSTNGYPLSRFSQPQWMVIPNQFATLILASDIFEPEKRILALQWLNEK
jgi:hypothetical protein